MKPVIVPMGGYAASGGYYIAAEARSIFAQETTVTGSIGVVAMIPSFEGMADKLNVQFETVATNRHGTLWSVMEKKTDEQIGIFQDWISMTYETFLGRVAAGRQMSRDEVHAVAQGRVWTGGRALTHGLVDNIGGLEDAIAFAAQEAGLGSTYGLSEHPYPQSMTEMLLESFGTARMGLIEQFGVGKVEAEAAPLLDQWKMLRAQTAEHYLYSYLPGRITW